MFRKIKRFLNKYCENENGHGFCDMSSLKYLLTATAINQAHSSHRRRTKPASCLKLNVKLISIAINRNRNSSYQLQGCMMKTGTGLLVLGTLHKYWNQNIRCECYIDFITQQTHKPHTWAYTHKNSTKSVKFTSVPNKHAHTCAHTQKNLIEDSPPCGHIVSIRRHRWYFSSQSEVSNFNHIVCHQQILLKTEMVFDNIHY